jgi:hypothetical protein
MSVKTPHQPDIAPQIHHNLPPQNTPKSEKPPVKHHNDAPELFSPLNHSETDENSKEAFSTPSLWQRNKNAVSLG